MSSVIIDRRLNDRNKSHDNRRRFIRRYKEQIKESIDANVAQGGVTGTSRNVSIRKKDISEPTFRHGPGGDRETVHPGNHKFNPGDKIPRPDGGQGRGKGDQGGDGDGEDGFTFTLTRDEFMQLFFDDLELPEMAKKYIEGETQFKWRNAGYTTTGSPDRLSVRRSLEKALGRRIAINGAIQKRIDGLQADFDAATDPVVQKEILEQIEIQEARKAPFLDDIDLRYRNREKQPIPISQAAMFCLMDVSASMDERKKDLAKRFMMLLHLFLEKKYEKIALIFIRHTDEAEECDEQKFFHDPKTGGTKVLSSFELMRTIIDARYPPAKWNIYGVYASDGDAFNDDPKKSATFLKNDLLPDCQYFAYIEVPDNKVTLSRLQREFRDMKQSLSMKDKRKFNSAIIMERREIYPAMRELFRKEISSLESGTAFSQHWKPT